jgi:putative colanic acid biosynthesis acetyltransferase WcaF
MTDQAAQLPQSDSGGGDRGGGDSAASRHASPWTTRQKIGRLLWSMVQATLFRFSPHNAYGWRNFLLRTFGAHIGAQVKIRPTVRIEVPWHLHIGDHTAIGDFAILYSLGTITTGRYVTISQYAHLCAGTHDLKRRAMTLLRPPIRLGDDVWIAADAFVGPGVSVGDRTVLGARASAFSDLPPDMIAVGNPARPIKPRPAMDR